MNIQRIPEHKITLLTPLCAIAPIGLETPIQKWNGPRLLPTGRGGVIASSHGTRASPEHNFNMVLLRMWPDMY